MPEHVCVRRAGEFGGTHAARVAANLDEFVIMGHALRDELLGLLDQPESFAHYLQRYAAEADDLKQQTLYHMRQLGRAV